MRQPQNSSANLHHLLIFFNYSCTISKLLLHRLTASTAQTLNLSHFPTSVVFWCPVPESWSTNTPGHVVSTTVTDTNRLLTYCHILGRNWLVNTNSFARNLWKPTAKLHSLYAIIYHAYVDIKRENGLRRSTKKHSKAAKRKKKGLLEIGVNINRGCFVDIFFHVVRSYDRLGSLDCRDCLSPVSHRWITIIWPQSRKQMPPRFQLWMTLIQD